MASSSTSGPDSKEKTTDIIHLNKFLFETCNPYSFKRRKRYQREISQRHLGALFETMEQPPPTWSYGQVKTNARVLRHLKMVHWQDAQGIFIASELQNRKFGETQIHSENCYNITAVERHLLR